MMEVWRFREASSINALPRSLRALSLTHSLTTYCATISTMLRAFGGDWCFEDQILMSKLFGGKDPFDDPFFTQPFGGNLFDHPFFSRPFGDQPGSSKQITIEELNPDDDGVKTSDGGKELIVQNPNKNASGTHNSLVYRKVAYGGLDGMSYTCAEGRMTGGDGVFLAEMKEEDKIVGESLHTISKGIHNKGHSVTTKSKPHGRNDSLQTLHNLNEDELAKFEGDWKSNANKYFPGWDNGFNVLENAGTNWIEWDGFPNRSGWGGWALPSAEQSENGGAVVPAGGERDAKKVTRVNIE